MMGKLTPLSQEESEQLFEDVRDALGEGHEWYRRAGYVASEDVNKIIRLVEARLLHRGASVKS